MLEKCRLGDGFIWQKSQSQGVARITKEVTETIETWIVELAPNPKSSAMKKELVEGRVTYTRKGNNLTLNLKKIDEQFTKELFDFISNRLN